MKQKSHKGAQKRVKVRKSGSVRVDKAARRHLLTAKSKRQKRSSRSGMEVDKTRMDALRKLLPGQVK